MFFLGIYEVDTEIAVSLELKDEPIYLMTNQNCFFSMDVDLFKSTFDDLKKGNLDIQTFADDHIVGTVSVPESRDLLFTSIPFDEGWQITVDGERAELVRTSDALLAVPITPGEHQIEFRYRPACYTVGTAISRISFATFIALIALDEWRKRRELRRFAEANHIY